MLKKAQYYRLRIKKKKSTIEGIFDVKIRNVSSDLQCERRQFKFGGFCVSLKITLGAPLLRYDKILQRGSLYFL